MRNLQKVSASPAIAFACVLSEDANAIERRKARQDAFLQALPSGGWRRATESVGVADTDVLRWMRTDADFRERLAQANAAIAAHLESIVDEIARGERQADSVQLNALTFRLKALKPETYRERSSVSVDQRTTVALEGDAGRARSLLAEWGA